VGPALAAILFVAGSEESMWHGTSLMGAYAVGLGVPFLLAALGARPFMAFMRRFRRHVRKVEIALGCLVVATGVLFLTGSMADIAFWMLDAFPGLA
jgi:cytochrome c-type biogenesis protein